MSSSDGELKTADLWTILPPENITITQSTATWCLVQLGNEFFQNDTAALAMRGRATGDSSLMEQFQNLTVIFSSFSTNEIVKKPRVSIKLKIKPKHSSLFLKSLLTEKYRISLSHFGTCQAWLSKIPVCARNWFLSLQEGKRAGGVGKGETKFSHGRAPPAAARQASSCSDLQLSSKNNYEITEH